MYYYKTLQYLLKSLTGYDAVSFREPASFHKHGSFPEILKQVFKLHFLESSLPTYFSLTINY